MAQPQLVYEDVRAKLDEILTADGDPYSDALAVICYTLERALGPASGGMGQSEWNALGVLASVTVGLDDYCTIDVPDERR